MELPNIKILDESNKILRQVSKEVTFPLDEETKKLINDSLDYLEMSQMEEYIEKYDLRAGMGLSFVQIGILKRMFTVLTYDEKGQLHKYALVNPKIISTSVAKAYLNTGEGCLSVSESHQGFVKRYNKIKLKAYDHISKQNVTLTLKGYVAIVVQHEYDHLDGVLYYDRINKQNPFKIDEEDIEIV